MRWVAFGAAAVAAVVLRDIGAQLRRLGPSDERAYGAEVFTGPGVPWEVSDLSAAIAMWHGELDATPVLKWLSFHLLIDGLVLAPALFVLFGALLWFASGSHGTAQLLAGGFLVIDFSETVVTGIVLVGNRLDLDRISDAALGVIQGLATVKWLWIGVIATVFVLLLRTKERGEWSLPQATKAIATARAGGLQPCPVALAGVGVVVALFWVVVAVPAGGPLEQIPDVLRSHISGAPGGSRFGSPAAFAVLVVGVYVGGLLATASSPDEGLPQPWSKRVVGAAVGLTVVTFAAAWRLDGRVNLGTLSWVAVAAAVWGAAHLRARLPRPDPPTPSELECTCAAQQDDAGVPTAAEWETRRRRWVGGLAGLVVVAGGIGLVRAAVLPLLVGVDAPGRWRWWTAVGVVGAVAGGSLTQRAVLRGWAFVPMPVAGWFRRRVGTRWRIGGAAAVILGLSWLAGWPSQAHWVGTTGAIAIGFAGLALLVGALAWLSRHRSWPRTQQCGLGVRTPWLGLLVAVWLFAGAFDTYGGYHDTRTVERAEPTSPPPPNLTDAFEQWLRVQDSDQCPPGDGPVPMLLVAAPGGGIRAAYWTAAALESLVGDAGGCGAARVFAISGVSGGSVGAAAWASAGGQSASDAARGMARDEALAAGVAALLTRDLVQPLVGVQTGWWDRAVQFEEGWRASSGVFGLADTRLPRRAAGGLRDDGAARWSDLAVAPAGHVWQPVLVLNAASVTDGCRVVVANIAALAATGEEDCQTPPGSGKAPAGPISAALDVRWPFATAERAAAPTSGSPTDCHPAELRTATAALLSARFPYVTPAGVLRDCPDDGDDVARATHAVDGGYYENSGLLTLLQLWAELAPEVTTRNAARDGRPVQPWIVVLDNGYRSDRPTAPPPRPRQLLAPLEAVGARTGTLSPVALEQQAAHAVRCTLAGLDLVCPPRRQSTFVRIAPDASRGLTAPLGWVLSLEARRALDDQLATQLCADKAARTLHARLAQHGAPEPSCEQEPR